MIVDNNYIVMIVVLIIWTGIFMYLFSLDKKMDHLKRSSKNSNES